MNRLGVPDFALASLPEWRENDPGRAAVAKGSIEVDTSLGFGLRSDAVLNERGTCFDGTSFYCGHLKDYTLDPPHGVIVVRLRDGLIADWREYYYETELPWEEFTAANPF